MSVTKKFIFFGFLDKQDYLVRSWWVIELPIMALLCFASLLCTAHPYAILAWVVIYILVTITIAVISFCHVLNFYRIATKSAKLISKHKDKELGKIFSRGPFILKWIIVCSLLYPATWIFGFLFKLMFSNNVEKMKSFIVMSQEREWYA